MSAQPSKGRDKTTGISSRTAQIVQSHLHAAQQLPEPPETFYRRDLPSEAKDVFDKFWRNDVVERVGLDPDSRKTHKWQVKPKVAEAIDRFSTSERSSGRVTPCCHVDGFRNLRDGGYECTRCDGEFSEFETMGEEGADG